MKKVLALIFLTAAVFGLSQTASAEEDGWTFNTADIKMLNHVAVQELSDDGQYNVTELGANGQDTADDTQAFVDALNMARVSQVPITIHVPAGTYYIGKTLPIYSNTSLILDAGATLVATFSEGSMLLSSHLDASGNICGYENCTHGGYSQVQNVTIEGGVWDRHSDGNGLNAIIKFRHGHNITLKNLTCKNATNHYINLSGVDTALVDHIQCIDHVPYVGDSQSYWDSYQYGDTSRYNSTEAIHFDYTGGKGKESNAYPQDGTAPRNITIQNSLFRNMHAGVGNHHQSAGTHISNVKVLHNTFENIRANCINAYDFDALTATGNVAKNTRKLVYLEDTTGGEISGNTVQTTSGIAIHISGGSNVRITNNTVSGAGKTGISLAKVRGGTISGNRVTGTAAPYWEILVDSGCAGVVVQNNYVGKRGLSLGNEAANRKEGNQFEPHTHQYGGWVTLQSPTAVTTGLQSRICSICGAQDTQSIAKLKAKIKVSMTTIPLKVKQSYTVEVSGLARGDYVKSWKSSNSKIATVSQKGTIKGKKAGKTKVTVQLASGLKKTLTVKVQKSAVKTTKLTLNYAKYTLKKGQKLTLTAKISPLTSKQKVTFKSSNKKVAKVNSKGVVTAKKKGTAVITVKSGSKSKKCKITVKK